MSLFAEDALTPDGWRRDVRIDVDSRGVIVTVQPGAAAEAAERVDGPLVPGMPNLHSHAFQRAISGRTGSAGADGDSFWTWRAAMYAFLDRVDADAFAAIAAQAYVEMLKAGYTRVAEFHYVHHDPQGKPYADPAELARRIVDAARATGIALTLLPVFYAHAGFGGAPPTPGQRRFVHSLASYSRVIETLARDAARGEWNLGIAPHSLRAVTAEELAAIVALVPPNVPIHIHAAEQEREVAECVAWSGARPIAWLLDHAHVDARWCVVHATHMTAEETRGLAASDAVAGLAPTTEADLGDGTFARARVSRRRRGVRRGQRLEHDHRPVRRAAPARMVAATRALVAQRARDRGRAGRANALRCRGARRRARNRRLGRRDRGGFPRGSRRARHRGSCTRGAGRSTRCSTRRYSVRAADPSAM